MTHRLSTNAALVLAILIGVGLAWMLIQMAGMTSQMVDGLAPASEPSAVYTSQYDAGSVQ